MARQVEIKKREVEEVGWSGGDGVALLCVALLDDAAIQCLTLPTLANQYVSYTNSRNYPSTATYSCADGFVLTQPQYATRNCVADSTGVSWELGDYPPSCIGEGGMVVRVRDPMVCLWA